MWMAIGLMTIGLVAYTAYLVLDAMDHSATRTLAVMILGFVLPLTILTLVIGVVCAVWRKPGPLSKAEPQ